VTIRALLDTNVLVSYLLSSARSTSAAGAVIHAALDGQYRLLFPAGGAEELDRKLVERPDLAAPIPRQAASDPVQLMSAVVDHMPRLPEPFPEIERDRKDDYPIANSVVAAADFLVSWDRDLTDPGAVEGVHIVDPPGFLRLLRECGNLGDKLDGRRFGFR